MDYGRMDMVNGNYMEENNRRMAEEEQRRKAEEERRRAEELRMEEQRLEEERRTAVMRGIFRMGQRGVCPVLHILSV